MDKVVQTIFKSINGNEFLFQAKEKDESVHILQTGYIISPSGDVAIVYDSDSHSNIFSNYIHYYLEENYMTNYELFEGAKKLIQLNHIIYVGPKITDISKNITGNELCVLIIPDFDDISDIQVNFINELLESNKPKITFNKDSQLIQMQIANISGDEKNKEYTVQELKDFINHRENSKCR